MGNRNGNSGIGGAGKGQLNQSAQKRGVPKQVVLPRTGIEYPFMKERPRFKEDNKEFEPIHCMSVRVYFKSDRV